MYLWMYVCSMSKIDRLYPTLGTHINVSISGKLSVLQIQCALFITNSIGKNAKTKTSGKSQNRRRKKRLYFPKCEPNTIHACAVLIYCSINEMVKSNIQNFYIFYLLLY